MFVLASRDPLTNEQRKGEHSDVTGNTGQAWNHYKEGTR